MFKIFRALSSVVERHVYTVLVGGSNPSVRTLTLVSGLSLLMPPLLAAQTTPESAEAAPAPAAKTVFVIPIKETIDVGLKYFFNRAMKEATEAKADFIILDMNTPGGRGDVMEGIMDELMKFEPREGTITYVNKEAGSAGAIIAAATKTIYMSPGAVIGAATPIVMSEAGGIVELPEKFLSYYSAKARSMAELNGHIPEVFEAMVRKDSGLELFGETIVKPGNILTFTAEQAIRRVGQPPRTILAEGIFASLDELITEVAGPNAKVVEAKRSKIEHLAYFLVLITPGLFTIALICGYLEFQSPGFGIPGSIAIVCLLLAYFGHYVGGMTGYESLLLIGLGLILIGVELFVLPGVMISGLVGAFFVLVGVLWMITEPGIAPPVAPDSQPLPITLPPMPTWESITQSLTKLSISFALAVILIVALSKFLPRLPFQSRIVLSGAGPAAIDSNLSELRLHPGDLGMARTPLRPSGTATFGGHPADVITEGDFIAAGESLEVLRLDGNKIVVRKVASL